MRYFENLVLSFIILFMVWWKDFLSYLNVYNIFYDIIKKLSLNVGMIIKSNHLKSRVLFIVLSLFS